MDTAIRTSFACVALSGAIALTACGGGSAYPSSTAGAPATATATRTPAVVVITGTTPSPAATSAPPAATATADATRQGASGIEGRVTIEPTCPVQRIDSPCPDRPYEATMAILDASRRQVASVRSGADGRFRMLLPPGDYTLVPQTTNTPPTAREQTVIVVDRAFTTVQIVFDSGIR